MRKMHLMMFMGFSLFSCGTRCFAQDLGYSQAKSYVSKVFNDSFVISSNNAKVRTKFQINNCNINYTMVINGMNESQSCNIKYLDLNTIDAVSGGVNIGTINEERRVRVSSLPQKYWAMSLSYNSAKYPDEKVKASFIKVLSSCK